MRAIDAEQMANDVDIAYYSACKKITDEVNAGVNYAVHYKIQRLIADTPELPTMQSNLICVYCEHPNAPLMTSNVETNICWQCGASHQWCMFKGKRIIEVE